MIDSLSRPVKCVWTVITAEQEKQQGNLWQCTATIVRGGSVQRSVINKKVGIVA
jgi:hypothetical protein